MLRHGYDETNGIAIGELTASYRIYYDGRKQHEWTDKQMPNGEAEKKTKEWIKEKEEEMGKMLFSRVYPANKWELRIYN